MHPKMEVARLLGLDARVLTKCIRHANISPTVSPDDRRKQLFTDDMVRRIREAHVALYGHAPYGDLVAEVEELKRRVARLEAEGTHGVRTPLPVPAPAVAARVARPRPVLTRPLSTGLPAGLVGWREFATLHGIPERTVTHKIERGELSIVPGKWKVGNVTITQALNAAGRHQFAQLWGSREEWRLCPDCPHIDDEAALPLME